MDQKRSSGVPEHAIEVLNSDQAQITQWQMNVLITISIVCIVLAVLQVIVAAFVWIKT